MWMTSHSRLEFQMILLSHGSIVVNIGVEQRKHALIGKKLIFRMQWQRKCCTRFSPCSVTTIFSPSCNGTTITYWAIFFLNDEYVRRLRSIVRCCIVSFCCYVAASRYRAWVLQEHANEQVRRSQSRTPHLVCFFLFHGGDGVLVCVLCFVLNDYDNFCDGVCHRLSPYRLRQSQVSQSKAHRRRTRQDLLPDSQFLNAFLQHRFQHLCQQVQ